MWEIRKVQSPIGTNLHAAKSPKPLTLWKKMALSVPILEVEPNFSIFFKWSFLFSRLGDWVIVRTYFVSIMIDFIQIYRYCISPGPFMHDCFLLSSTMPTLTPHAYATKFHSIVHVWFTVINIKATVVLIRLTTKIGFRITW